MEKENEEVKDTEAETPETETQEGEETKGLSLDDALEKALGSKEEEPNIKESEPEKPEEKPAEPIVEAPAEFSPEEKTAWEKGDLKSIHAAFKRLHQSRTAELSRLDSDYGPYKRLAEGILPYLHASGKKGKDPTKAIIEAVQVLDLINENPHKALKEIAALKGLKLEDLAKPGQPKEVPDEIKTLQDQVNRLSGVLEAQRVEGLGKQFGSVFDTLQAEKNPAGEPRFPDLRETQAGIELAGRIGSTIRSPEFQSAVRARIPGATLRELVVEAYKWWGGRVSDTPSQGSSPQDNKTHIEKARRASASVPGRVAKGPLAAKKGSLDYAIDAALEGQAED